MANLTFEQLPAGTPLGTDIIASQQPGGQTQQYTLDDIDAYVSALGEIHSNTDYTQTGVTTSPQPLIGYDASLVAVGITATLTPVSGSNSGKFVVNKAGIYRVTFNIEVGSTGNDNFDFQLFLNGAPTQFKASVDMRNAAIDSGSAGLNTFIALVVPDEIEVYVNIDGGGASDYLVDSLTFTCEKVTN